jgi:hypothetical protein
VTGPAYVVTIYRQRPSEHKITILRETLTCPHARKHIELLTHLLDVIAYDCGVDQTEFKELAGRVERIKELVALLRNMPRRRLPERMVNPNEEAKATGSVVSS